MLSLKCVFHVFRGHYLYKSLWTPTKDEHLQFKEDDRTQYDGTEYDKHALGIYKRQQNKLEHGFVFKNTNSQYKI